MNIEREEKRSRVLIYILAVVLIVFMIYMIYDSYDTKKYLRQVQSEKVGIASWYGKGLNKDGTIFKGHLYSCASDYFDRYDLLLVENVITKKKVMVWNNDTHEATDIIIDLSESAFKKISNLRIGKVIVKVTRLGKMIKPNPDIFGRIMK